MSEKSICTEENCDKTATKNKVLDIYTKCKDHKKQIRYNEKLLLELCDILDIKRDEIKTENKIEKKQAQTGPKISQCKRETILIFTCLHIGCDNKVERDFRSVYEEARLYCDEHKSEYANKKRETTYIAKHGVKNVANDPKAKEKREQTNLDRYEAKTPFSSSIIQERIKETNIANFGGTNPSQNIDVQKKKKQNRLDNNDIKYRYIYLYKLLLESNAILCENFEESLDETLLSRESCIEFICSCGNMRKDKTFRMIEEHGAYCSSCQTENMIKKLKKIKEDNFEYKDSLEVCFPEISKEWHPTKNGELIPSKVNKYSQKTAWWICNNSSICGCIHEYEAPISNRTFNNSKCPFCFGSKKICFHQSLEFCFPEISNEWDYEKNEDLLPSNFSPGSNYKAWWKTVNCKHPSYQMRIRSRTGKKSTCPACYNKTEGIILRFLDNIFKGKVIQRYAKDWCKNKNHLPLDLCIEELKIIVECDGPHHFEKVYYSKKTPKETQETDIYKMKCANNNGFSVIRIIQENVFHDKYDWQKELLENINKIKEGGIVQNIYMCKNDEYNNHIQLSLSSL